MNKLKKSIILILLLLAFIQFNYSQTFKKTPMSELTNPLSRNYVPIPYPQTREDVIKNVKNHFKYSKKKYFTFKQKRNQICTFDKSKTLFENMKYLYKYLRRKFNKTNRRKSTSYRDKVIKTFALDDSEFEIGEIVFVKDFSHDKNYKDKETIEYLIKNKDIFILVDILNIDYKVVGRLRFSKKGKYAGGAFTDTVNKRYYEPLINLESKNEIFHKLLSKYTKNVIFCEYISYSAPGLGYSLYPIIKIAVDDISKMFYYNFRTKKMFSEVQVRRFNHQILYPEEKGSEDDILYKTSKYRLYDSIKEEVIYLKLIECKF